MSRWRELLGVAFNGLSARKIRTALIMLGPIVGVAAMVGAVGLTESAKGDLKAKLAALGTNLITVEAGGSFGQQNPTMPKDAVHRVMHLQSVTRASAVGEVSGVLTIPHAGAEKYYEAFPVPVLAADTALPGVLEVKMQSGRWLRESDRLNHARAAVIGEGLAKEYGVIPGEIRTLRLNNIDYGIVGVLNSVALDPSLDNAVFVTQWGAKHDFGTEGKPTKLYVRSAAGETEATSKAIPTAINLGGPDSVSTKIPSDALAASAQADETLQQTAVFAGILALAVGGIGIANVMSISVIQRSTEIGIRRALGQHAFHDRSPVPARGALHRHPRRSRRCGRRRRRRLSRIRVRGMDGGHRLGAHAPVGRARRRGVRRRRPLPLGEGCPARTTGDLAPRLGLRRLGAA